MYYHNRQNFSEEQGLGYQMSGDMIGASDMKALGCQRIFSDQGIWKVYNHIDPTDHTLAGAEYVPPFSVRYILVEGSNHQIKYDMSFENGMRASTTPVRTCINLLAVEQLHKMHITKVYLDADTTVDAITFFF